MSQFLTGLAQLNPQVKRHNGGTSTLTLDQSGTTNATLLFINGVAQSPGTDFSVSGATLTTSSALPAGTNIATTIQYFNTGIVSAPADSSVTSGKISSEALTGQTSATIAAGDTILLSDVDDSGNLKQDTVQGILDLVSVPANITWVGASTLSGGSVDFTVATTATQIFVALSQAYPSGTTTPGIQLGDAGGVETTSYDSGTVGANSTTAFILGAGHSLAKFSLVAVLSLVNPATYLWSLGGGGQRIPAASGGDSTYYGGSKALSDVITTVRVVDMSGTWSSGTANVGYI